MYELDWASDKLWAAEGEAGGLPNSFESRLPRDAVARTMLLFWGEHCLECAPPQCCASSAASAFPPRRGDEATFLTLYPENDQERRLIFTWLDFVKYADDRRPRTA